MKSGLLFSLLSMAVINTAWSQPTGTSTAALLEKMKAANELKYVGVAPNGTSYFMATKSLPASGGDEVRKPFVYEINREFFSINNRQSSGDLIQLTVKCDAQQYRVESRSKIDNRLQIIVASPNRLSGEFQSMERNEVLVAIRNLACGQAGTKAEQVLSVGKEDTPSGSSSKALTQVQQSIFDAAILPDEQQAILAVLSALQQNGVLRFNAVPDRFYQCSKSLNGWAESAANSLVRRLIEKSQARNWDSDYANWMQGIRASCDPVSQKQVAERMAWLENVLTPAINARRENEQQAMKEKAIQDELALVEKNRLQQIADAKKVESDKQAQINAEKASKERAVREAQQAKNLIESRKAYAESQRLENIRNKGLTPRQIAERDISEMLALIAKVKANLNALHGREYEICKTNLQIREQRVQDVAESMAKGDRYERSGQPSVSSFHFGVARSTAKNYVETWSGSDFNGNVISCF